MQLSDQHVNHLILAGWHDREVGNPCTPPLGSAAEWYLFGWDCAREADYCGRYRDVFEEPEHDFAPIEDTPIAITAGGSIAITTPLNWRPLC